MASAPAGTDLGVLPAVGSERLCLVLCGSIGPGRRHRVAMGAVSAAGAGEQGAEHETEHDCRKCTQGGAEGH